MPQFGGSSSGGDGSSGSSGSIKASSEEEPVRSDSYGAGDQSRDVWEKSGKFWVRHHVSPRQSKFTPYANSQGGSQKGGPDPAKLKPSRTTYIQWSEKGDPGETIFDEDWRGPNSHANLGIGSWTGTTTFEEEDMPFDVFKQKKEQQR